MPSLSTTGMSFNLEPPKPTGVIGTNAGTIPVSGGLTGGFLKPLPVPSLDSMLNKPEFTSKYLWNIDGQNVALYVALPEYNGSYKVSDAGDAETDTFSTDLRINNTLNNPSGFTRTQNGRLFVDLLGPLGKIYEVTGPNTLKSTTYPVMMVAELANQVKSKGLPVQSEPPKPLPVVVTQEPPKPEPVKPLPVVVDEPQKQPPNVLPVLPKFQFPTDERVYVKMPELKLPPSSSQSFTSDGALTSNNVSAPFPLKLPNLLPEADSKTLLMAAIAAAGAGYFTYKQKGATWAAALAAVAFFGVQKALSLTK